MAHANARLNVFGRRTLVERVLAGQQPGEVAKQLGVSRTTVYKWLRRFRVEGLAGLADRSSRPHRSPRRVPAELVARIVTRRRDEQVGARELAILLGVPASTIGAVLRRAQVPHLAQIDRITGEPVRSRRHSQIRYEHDRPGSLLHVDVKKLGKVPPVAGGGCTGEVSRSAGARSTGVGWAGTTCMSPSMTTAASPTPKSYPTSEPPPARRFYTAPATGCASSTG